MPLFRKRSVVIEAWQYKGDTSHFPEAFQDAILVLEDDGFPRLCIETLEGEMLISDGDWIIKGVQGEFYPCKHPIFAMTYESLYQEDHL